MLLFLVGFATLARPHGDARGGHSRPRPTALFRISPLLSTRRYVSPPRQVRVPRSATEHRPGQWWSTCSHCCSATTYLPRFESCGTAVADKPFVMHTQYVITSDRACIIGDLPRLDPACTASAGPDACRPKSEGACATSALRSRSLHIWVEALPHPRAQQRRQRLFLRGQMPRSMSLLRYALPLLQHPSS